MSVDVAPADPVHANAEQESFSVDWRGGTCHVKLCGAVTAHSLEHLSELLRGVGLAGGRVLISLADVIVTHNLSAELVALSRCLAGAGTTLEVRFIPAT